MSDPRATLAKRGGSLDDGSRPFKRVHRSPSSSSPLTAPPFERLSPPHNSSFRWSGASEKGREDPHPFQQVHRRHHHRHQSQDTSIFRTSVLGVERRGEGGRGEGGVRNVHTGGGGGGSGGLGGSGEGGERGRGRGRGRVGGEYRSGFSGGDGRSSGSGGDGRGRGGGGGSDGLGSSGSSSFSGGGESLEKGQRELDGRFSMNVDQRGPEVGTSDKTLSSDPQYLSPPLSTSIGRSQIRTPIPRSPPPNPYATHSTPSLFAPSTPTLAPTSLSPLPILTSASSGQHTPASPFQPTRSAQGFGTSPTSEHNREKDREHDRRTDPKRDQRERERERPRIRGQVVLTPLQSLTVHLMKTYVKCSVNGREKKRSQRSSSYYPVEMGEIIHGNYQVIEKIGKGSFGIVVKAAVLKPSPSSSRSTTKSNSTKPDPVSSSSSSGTTPSSAPSPGRSSGSSKGSKKHSLPTERDHRSTNSDAMQTEPTTTHSSSAPPPTPSSTQAQAPAASSTPSPSQTPSSNVEFVAIKILRRGISFVSQGRREIMFLKLLQDQAEFGLNFIVNIIDEFMYDGHLCIVFELLSHSLLDLLNFTLLAEPPVPGLSMRMVHKLSHQLLSALVELQALDVVHCDIKPENIALTSPNKAHVKLLDFGSACYSHESICNLYPYIQSRYYRAPEVLLGNAFSHPIDMWSLGCVLVELYLAHPLFSGRDSCEQLYSIIDVLGTPPQQLLGSAAYLNRFFVTEPNSGHLNPRIPYKWKRKNLWMILSSGKSTLDPHLPDFFNLVSAMLQYIPEDRITPQDALTHSFMLYGPAVKRTKPMQGTQGGPVGFSSGQHS